MINHLRIENFRSIKTIDFDLPPLSYFCGPNASGKTNLSEALDFLSEAFRRGLSYAVADKGGFYNMCFRRERRSRGAISFGVTGVFEREGFSLETAVWFSIQTRGQAIRSDFYVENESYSFRVTGKDTSGLLRVYRQNDSYTSEVPESFPEGAEEVFPMVAFAKEEGFPFGSEVRADPRSLLYSNPFLSFFPFGTDIQELASIRVFRINPRTARQSGIPSVLGELGKFGENLPSALDSLQINHPKIFRQLEDLIKEVIPGLTSLRTRYTASRQMGLFLEEKGFGTPWDAEELSDGTLMSIALFLALLDPGYQRVVVEEPENSLHPWILRKFLDCCRDLASSGRKQVVLTTQSPLVVATAAPDNLFLVERADGMTQVSRAIERDTVLPEMLKRQFLDLGQYWLSGGLGAVPVPETDQRDLFEEGAG